MILLVTLNSTYQHTAFGLRYLKANMGELQEQTEILEPTIQYHPRDLAEKILVFKPEIIGLGVYIWNAQQSLELVTTLKKIAPSIPVVLGGPEVSHESEAQEIVKRADYTIQGEADFLFYELCQKILRKESPAGKIIRGALPEISKIQLPYSLYSDDDIKNRIIYVEASRGCPYKCEYCLSSLDKQVRSFDLDLFLSEIDALIQRGARQFKFVDRTFNLSPTTSSRILRFFLERIDKGLFLHFEMVPDRLPSELRDLIQKFPEGSLQFEIGIQTWNPQVAALVSRKNDLIKVRENFQFLTEQTGVHIHADLIAGLPGEDLASFGKGFDELVKLKPHEIQVGILKRLKGTPISRHEREWEMIYQETQPFQILQTKNISFAEIQFMNRFAKYWDHYANSGNFVETLEILKEFSISQFSGSLFAAFSDFTDFLGKRFPQSHHLSLENLAEAFWDYLTRILLAPSEKVEAALIQDYCYRVKRRDLPQFLKRGPSVNGTRVPNSKEKSLVRRQAAHQSAHS